MAKKKSKWKKRIKKALKGAAIAGGALLAAKALSGRGRTTAANVDSGRGSDLRPTNVGPVSTYKHKDDIMKFPNAGVAVGVDYQASPYERSQVAPYLKGIKRSPVDRSGPSPWDNWSGDNWAAKKGGRAGHRSGGSVKGVGKAKRGFGRALKKGK